VFGLLGLLVTIAITAFLVVQVLDGVDGSDDAIDVQLDPGSPTVTTGAAGPVDGGRTASCAVAHDTIETAAEAYKITNGTYPADMATLVASGLLVPKGALDFELHVEGDAVVVTGTGGCAGS
jgi:hypothetical protein